LTRAGGWRWWRLRCASSAEQWVMVFRLALERHYFIFIDWRSSACEVFE